jgi:hypothetical protein
VLVCLAGACVPCASTSSGCASLRVCEVISCACSWSLLAPHTPQHAALSYLHVYAQNERVFVQDLRMLKVWTTAELKVNLIAHGKACERWVFVRHASCSTTRSCSCNARRWGCCWKHRVGGRRHLRWAGAGNWAAQRSATVGRRRPASHTKKPLGSRDSALPLQRFIHRLPEADCKIEEDSRSIPSAELPSDGLSPLRPTDCEFAITDCTTATRQEKGNS